MRIFISFDLHKADGNNYTDLYEYLEKIGAVQASESFYVVKETNLTPESIRDAIVKITGGNITVIVGPMASGVCTNKVANADKWLEK